MTIRTFQTGDDVALVSIYNEAAADLPHFKPATLDEIRRRCNASDFDPAARFFAVADGKPVGYVTVRDNGRVSYPWCRRGFESFQGPLFDAALAALKERGFAGAFAAYRADWPQQERFFLDHGFQRAREMVNFRIDLMELPTPAGRPGSNIAPMKPADLPAVLKMACPPCRARTEEELERHLFHNAHFPADAVSVLRGRSGGEPLAASVLVADDRYANPHDVDAGMPCFWLGAFGTEGMQTKRVNGLFSFVASDPRNISLMGLEFLSYSTMKISNTEVETFAAQVPSDAEPLLRFYSQYFRRQGSFPIYQCTF